MHFLGLEAIDMSPNLIKKYYFDLNSFGAFHKSAALISKIALHNHYQGHFEESFDYLLAKQA